METRRLDRSDWKYFFDFYSDLLSGKLAEIEVASLSIRDQIEAKWLYFRWLTYDPKNDVIEIALENLDHTIHRPSEVYLAFGPDGLSSVEVTDQDGVQRVVKLRAPPSPAAAVPAALRRTNRVRTPRDNGEASALAAFVCYCVARSGSACSADGAPAAAGLSPAAARSTAAASSPARLTSIRRDFSRASFGLGMVMVTTPSLNVAST
jgi:hypothetical protein